MTVGIIGAGAIGQALATQALRAGHDVIVANRRGPDTLAALVAELGPGATAGTVSEAAQAKSSRSPSRGRRSPTPSRASTGPTAS